MISSFLRLMVHVRDPLPPWARGLPPPPTVPVTLPGAAGHPLWGNCSPDVTVLHAGAGGGWTAGPPLWLPSVTKPLLSIHVRSPVWADSRGGSWCVPNGLHGNEHSERGRALAGSRPHPPRHWAAPSPVPSAGLRGHLDPSSPVRVLPLCSQAR